MQRLDSAQELRALPPGAVVRSVDGDIWERHSIGWDNLSTNGETGVLGSTDIDTPALLLWHPNRAKYAPPRPEWADRPCAFGCDCGECYSRDPYDESPHHCVLGEDTER